MENTREINIKEIAQLLWSKKKKIVIYSFIGACTGIVIAFSVPKEYTCSITVAPESSSANSSMSALGGLASALGGGGSVGSDGIGSNVYPVIVKSSPFIKEFNNISVVNDSNTITLFDYILDNQKTAWWKYILSFPSATIRWIFSSDEVMEQQEDPFRPTGRQKAFENALSDNIEVVEDKRKGVISIDVKMQNPEIAAIVADSLLVKLQAYMTRYYTSKSAADLRNNEEMLNNVRQNYYIADSLYAQAVDKNQNLISNYARLKLDRLFNEKTIAFSAYQQIAMQVEMLKMKVQEETPVITVIEPARVPILPSAPNKKVIVIVFIFAFAFIYSGVEIIKYIKSHKYTNF